METDQGPPQQTHVLSNGEDPMLDEDILAASRIVEFGSLDLNFSLGSQLEASSNAALSDSDDNGTLTPRPSDSNLPPPMQTHGESTSIHEDVREAVFWQHSNPSRSNDTNPIPQNPPPVEDTNHFGDPEFAPQHGLHGKGKGRATEFTQGEFFGGTDTDAVMNESEGGTQVSRFILLSPVRATHATQDRPATVDDILRLGMSIKRSQEEMANAILNGLDSLLSRLLPRAGNTTSMGTTGEHAGDADDESLGPSRRTGLKKYGRKRRSLFENNLSVRHQL